MGNQQARNNHVVTSLPPRETRGDPEKLGWKGDFLLGGKGGLTKEAHVG